jgi:hypothetical protein
VKKAARAKKRYPFKTKNSSIRMKKLQLWAFIGFAALLSGCACECADDFPMLRVELKNFSPQEIGTVYILREGSQDTCFTCIDPNGQGVLAILGVSANTQYHIKSDSIPLDKVIRVNDIRTETTKEFACECTSFTGIDYVLDGDNYTSEPIVITK